MEVKVKIEWDEPKEQLWLCADNIQIALSAYCKNTKFKVQELKKLPIHGVTNWVAIKDRMPESGQCVMIYSKDGGVAEGAYISAKGHFEQWRWNAIQKDVTHWKPLCEPPCL